MEFSTGEYTFEKTGKIIRTLKPLLGNPNINTTVTVKGVQQRKVTGFSLSGEVGLQAFVLAYKALKEAGINLIPSDEMIIRLEIPNDCYISSFNDSEEPAKWYAENLRKVEQSKQKKERSKDPKIIEEKWKLKEVRTALDGRCSTHRSYPRMFQGKCLNCEENKKDQGLPNDYENLSSAWHDLPYDKR